MGNRKKIIIDTDAGHDDVLAILLLIGSKLFDIKAITTVAGNSTIENTTRNATYVLDLVSKSSIPIYSGKPTPLKRPLITAVVHGESGLDGVDTSKIKFALTGNADKKIGEILTKNPRKVTLLTLGPLINIARAILNNPTLERHIAQIVIMGGAINIPGNKNRVAEFNFFVDPEAADIIFKTHAKKVLIPIDICADILIQLKEFDTIRKSRIYHPLISMMKHFIKGIRKSLKVKGLLIYDAIAAYYLINPRAYQLKPMDIVIETTGEHTFGMTVVEKKELSG